jgi:hypothetical protein
MKPAFRYAIACLLVLCGAPALAMYRCGNVFQDKPCESGPEIRLSPSGRPTAAPPAARAASAPATAPATATPSSFAVACARVGELAQRIVWKREGGATREQQLAERVTGVSQAEHAQTVAAVYARRGSAPEVRAAIEAECVAERQKEADAAALLNQLRKQAGETPVIPAASPAPAAEPGATAQSTPNSPAPADGKPSAATCSRLRNTLAEANARLTQGGTARVMEALQNERRSAEASFRSSGCR